MGIDGASIEMVGSSTIRASVLDAASEAAQLPLHLSAAASATGTRN